MLDEAQNPLSEVTVENLLRLAQQYGNAACALRPMGREIGGASDRLCVFHAKLKKRSAQLLEQLSDSKAYTGSRYHLSGLNDGLHPNQIQALLAEIIKKVSDLLRSPPAQTLKRRPASA